MALPGARDVHIDRPLSNITVAYKNPEQAYIADMVFPLVPVGFQSDKYYIWDKDVWFRNAVQRRAPGAEYPEAYLKLSTDAYFCDIFHLAYPINEEDVANQDEMIELETAGAEFLGDQFQLNRELEFVSNFLKTGVWGFDRTGVTGVPGATQFRKWSELSTSNPVVDIQTWQRLAQEQSGLRPQYMLTGRSVFDQLKEHPDLLDKYKYTNTAILSQSQIEAALDISIIMGEAIVNTANEGLADNFSGSFIIKDQALLFYKPAAPGRKVASCGYTFSWNDVGGTGLQTPIRRYNEEARSRMLLQGRQAFNHKVVGKELGIYLSAVV